MFTIESVKAEEIAEVCELAVIAWQSIFDGYKEQLGDELFDVYYKDWKNNKYNEINNAFTNNLSRAYVLKDSLSYDKIVGFFSYFIENKTGVVCSNAIDPEYRGKGLSTKMYDFMFECMKREGAEYSKVTTGGDNAHFSARKAYEKAGFSASLPNVTYFKKL